MYGRGTITYAERLFGVSGRMRPSVFANRSRFVRYINLNMVQLASLIIDPSGPSHAVDRSNPKNLDGWMESYARAGRRPMGKTNVNLIFRTGSDWPFCK